MSEDLDRLGRQLEAIDLAIAEARTETDPEHREHILDIAQRASKAARDDYEAAKNTCQRPTLRIITGGLSATTVPVGLAVLATQARKHPAGTAAAGTALAAAAVGATLFFGQQHPGHQIASRPPAVTAPSIPGPSASTAPHAPRSSGPAGPPATTSPSPAAPPHLSPVPLPAASLSPAAPTPPDRAPTTTPASPPAAPPPTAGPTSTPPATPVPAPPSSPGVCLGIGLRPILAIRICPGVIHG